MRRADARLNASIITSSSIRWSFTGGQVGWITKTSWPRTFSLICTYTSPSEKRETSASPSGTLERLGDLLGERPIRVAGEELQLIAHACRRSRLTDARS